MSVQVDSTTDTPEQVTAATGNLQKSDKVEESKKSATPEKSEVKTPSESETLENESLDNDDSNESDEDTLEDSESKPKKKNGFQKRIDRFRKQLSEKDIAAQKAQIDADYWKAKALGNNPNEKAAPEASSSKESVSQKPDPNLFSTNAEYIEALTDWKLDQKEQKAKAESKIEQAKSEYQKQVDTHNQKINEFKKQTPDFEKIVETFLEENGDVKFSPALEELILTSDMGPAVVYELAKNSDEFDRINKLSLVNAGREFGKLEARLAKDSGTQKEVSKKTNAPAPLKTVGTSSTKASTKSPDEMDFKEYKKWRESNK